MRARKLGELLSLLLFSFIVSYLLSSAFNKYGLETNTILSSFFIVASTVASIEFIYKFFLSKKKAKW
ncbi:hypothetical protein BKP57_17860 [Virgibacillus sp. 6R]|nr:hypothetical protein BKP57_17860 [Virgibacillus sp. 6R]